MSQRGNGFVSEQKYELGTENSGRVLAGIREAWGLKPSTKIVVNCNTGGSLQIG